MPRKKMPAFRVERSAGGLVLDTDRRILMVRVKNLQGEIKWTFPKGHLEAKESDEQAALREVEEETGWLCVIVSRRGGKPFESVSYWFRKGELLIKKEVVWFLMRPLTQTGERDENEILEVEWCSLPEARRRASYPSDIKLLQKLKVTPRASTRRPR